MTNSSIRYCGVIFMVLFIAYIAYSFQVYTSGTNVPPELRMTPLAAQGQMVWQQYNCSSCHQIYGLGGYIGPDLTNVISEKGKGKMFVRAILKTGTDVMPDFRLSEEEINALIAFLEHTDKSGIFPNAYVRFTKYGDFILNER